MEDFKEGQFVEIFFNSKFKIRGYFVSMKRLKTIDGKPSLVNEITIKDIDKEHENSYVFHEKISKVVKLNDIKNNIYCITNLVNGKKYIGRTTATIEHRFKSHCSESKCAWAQTPLHIDMQKYGIDNFKVEKLYEYYANSPREANKVEQEFMKKYNTKIPYGYNVL